MSNTTPRGFESIFDNLLQEYIPPSVIIDESYEIVHIFKDVNSYLNIQPGKINFNLLKMVNKEVSVIISSMLHKVSKDKKSGLL